MGHVGGVIRIAGEDGWWLDLLLDSSQSGRQSRGVGEVWVTVGTRDTAFNSQAVAATHDAKPSRAII